MSLKFKPASVTFFSRKHELSVWEQVYIIIISPRRKRGRRALIKIVMADALDTLVQQSLGLILEYS